MTEAEWLASGDVTAMLTFVSPHTSRRKERLFAVACCRRHSELLDDVCRGFLDTLERSADEPLPCDESDALAQATWGHSDVLSSDVSEPHGGARWRMARAVFNASEFSASSLARATAQDVCRAVAAIATPPDQFEALRPGPPTYEDPPEDPVEEAAQLRLLRDIIGNPFRRPAFDPAWRTDTARALARQMYESRDFTAAPILADALQDAGCDYDDLLNHLRAPGGGSGEPAGGSPVQTPHVRGCWAVDLVLEKL